MLLKRPLLLENAYALVKYDELVVLLLSSAAVVFVIIWEDNGSLPVVRI